MIVLVMLVNDEGKVLVAKRSAQAEDCPNVWEFPGGKVEEGESLEAALIREMHEEIGMTTEKSCLAPFTFGFNHKGELMLCFICRVFELVLQEKLQTRETAWVLPKDLLHNYGMPDANTGMIAMLRDYL